MRICCPALGIVPGSKMTGAGAYDQNILRQLALLGAEVHVVLPEGGSLGTDMQERGAGDGLIIHTVRIPLEPRLLKSAARMVRFPRVVRSLYDQHNFDLLRVHSFFSSSLEALRIMSSHKLPVPAVVHFHHLDENAWRNLVVRKAMRCCDSVIAFSQAGRRDAVERLGVPPEKIHVVYHGIERRFRPAARSMLLLRQLGYGTEEQILLFLGILEPRKNPLFLLDVLRDLLASKKRLRLVIAGTGPLLATVRQRISQMGLENYVTLAGAVPEALKPDYYTLADVFVFPSTLEGFGLVMGEAMSCEKPVVALNTSAMPEVVEDGVTGFLASPHDKADFARKTLLLLDHEELRVRMGVQARERVERLFRWERAAKETLNIYQQTIEQFHSSPLRDSLRARARE